MLVEEEHHEPAESTSDFEQAIVGLKETYDLAEMRAAVAAMYFEVPQQFDSRYLWTTGRYSYFRVNRWTGPDIGGGHIRRSAFLRVEELGDGWRICDLTGSTGERVPSATPEFGLACSEVVGSRHEPIGAGTHARLNSANCVERNAGRSLRQLSSS